ncbi:hypothetical protein SAMN05421813_10145 [Daejeonella rubra]|uniref:Uncharacterized protein n=1 Tax=Daejeonella rubra TaxID=990371 RepID=A0A1G9LQ67_9SPHI|nr:hypothetical protein [Daejeonella rubra]SDL64073.1 hypothetical protein SAMN05421813_10145 [Daejeonella rubra]
MSHTFHIPVLGLAYSVDTPVKVARYGISSVVSIVDDMLIERMRKLYTEKRNETFVPIDPKEIDFRSKRITAYLNLIKKIVDEQFEDLRKQAFNEGTDVTRYFELLPDTSPLKSKYKEMLFRQDSIVVSALQQELRNEMQKGEIQVNIMAKVDRMNPDTNGEQLSDSLTALKGFAESNINSAVVLSAGMNPRLYSYLENFADFLPDLSGQFKKSIILKVSDFRSALIQAKFLAKKGLWVSEFRIESGLNCGGHAFATEGYLLGPILEEFKLKKQEMISELHEMYSKAILEKGIQLSQAPLMKISVQGGIGTANENNFLMEHYQLDATGWGSPFLLVPEATNVDEETLELLSTASKDDFYISNSSPLGIPFNNFRKSTSEKQRLERIAKGRPGSPCVKKFLSTNTEFTELPICTASREYQNLKIKQLEAEGLQPEDFQTKFNEITEKICLCEGLAAPAYLKNGILKPKESRAVAICPGPNIAYFSGKFSLDEMVSHIYGKLNLLNDTERPNLFVNELNLYVEYLKKDISKHLQEMSDKKAKYISKFKEQLQVGIDYYKQLVPKITDQTEVYRKKMMNELQEIEEQLQHLNPAVKQEV